MSLRSLLDARRGRRLARRLPPYQDGSDGPSHAIQFYSGAFPTERVAAFLRDGVAAGEVGVVVATPQHVAAVDALLGDLRAKVVYLDAGQALERFMAHGRPDRLRFLDSVGDIVEQAAFAGNGRVRAFGEIVPLLCEQGQPEAALELERLWNELAASHDLRLLCSYPLATLKGRAQRHAEPLRDAHSHALRA